MKIKSWYPKGWKAEIPIKARWPITVFQMVGGLRSGLGYVGAKDIADLQAKAKFVRITNAGLTESHPHDIYITKGSAELYQVIKS